MEMFTFFFFFFWIRNLWANFVQKSLNSLFKMKHCTFNYFEYREFDCDVHFSCFRQEISFLGKFSPKNRNYLLKLKFGNKSNSNMMMLNFLF